MHGNKKNNLANNRAGNICSGTEYGVFLPVREAGHIDSLFRSLSISNWISRQVRIYNHARDGNYIYINPYTFCKVYYENGRWKLMPQGYDI